YAKGQIPNPNALTYRVTSPKQLVNYRLTQHGHPSGTLDVTFVKKASLRHFPVAERRQQLVVTFDPRAPILVAEDDLGPSRGTGADCLHRRTLIEHCFKVFRSQSIVSSCSTSDPHCSHAPRPDHQRVGTHGGNLLLHLALRTLANTHHSNYSSDSDD